MRKTKSDFAYAMDGLKIGIPVVLASYVAGMIGATISLDHHTLAHRIMFLYGTGVVEASLVIMVINARFRALRYFQHFKIGVGAGTIFLGAYLHYLSAAEEFDFLIPLVRLALFVGLIFLLWGIYMGQDLMRRMGDKYPPK